MLIPEYGEAGASYAYALTYCLYVVITAIVVHWTCGIPLHPSRLAATIGFTGLASAIVVVCTQWPLFRIPLLIAGITLGVRSEMFETVKGAVLRRVALVRQGS
jgi:hypothetical protein